MGEAHRTARTSEVQDLFAFPSCRLDTNKSLLWTWWICLLHLTIECWREKESEPQSQHNLYRPGWAWVDLVWSHPLQEGLHESGASCYGCRQASITWKGVTVSEPHLSRVLDLCPSHRLSITKSMVKHKGVPECTRHQDIYNHRSLIDITVMSSDMQLYVLDIQEEKEAERSTDHHLVSWFRGKMPEEPNVWWGHQNQGFYLSVWTALKEALFWLATSSGWKFQIDFSNTRINLYSPIKDWSKRGQDSWLDYNQR